MSRRKGRRLPEEPVLVDVTDLGHDGRGVGRHDDKVVFVHGALPGEQVRVRLIGRNRRFDEGVVVEVPEPSRHRVEALCPWFDRCGGCVLQHMAPEAQIAWKQRRLATNFERIAKLEPGTWLPALTGPQWHYRRRARLSVRLVAAKGRVLVGFREPGGRYVADIEDCRVLDPAFADRLLELSGLIGRLSIPDRIPQIECAAGDDTAAIVLRHLAPLTEADQDHLREWSDATGIAVWLQPAGPSSTHRLHPREHRLRYRLDHFDVAFEFHPQQFIQVNAEINRQLTRRAVELMAPKPGERILDLFCGLGNFSLPLARSGATVIGVELADDLVHTARRNARLNGIDNAQFIAADLQQSSLDPVWPDDGFDGVLIDPPRSGAIEALEAVAATGARRIVYVSCDPATLARDAGELVHRHGFRLSAAGVADMFPHTGHVESVALFERASA
ncbi:MAG: 23S rRNA (uracil(1939)-C(5))-methyltransferase RlmD [Wenzhouxiangellaceae bacterium]